MFWIKEFIRKGLSKENQKDWIEIGDLWRVLKKQVSGLVLKRPRSAGRVSGFEKMLEECFSITAELLQ